MAQFILFIWAAQITEILSGVTFFGMSHMTNKLSNGHKGVIGLLFSRADRDSCAIRVWYKEIQHFNPLSN